MAEWTPDEAEAFGTALRSALIAKKLRQSDLARLLTSEFGTEVTQARVSQWVTATHEPGRREVFAIERALRLKPGSLSRTLGYLPLDARPVTTVEDAIEADPALSPEGREGVLGAYRAMAH